MAYAKRWKSPDEKLSKIVVQHGYYGEKPTENTECFIEILDIRPRELLKEVQSDYMGNVNYPLKVFIGHANTKLDREVDKVLQTMQTNEKSTITYSMGEKQIVFDLKLHSFKVNGYIYNWSVLEKCTFAHQHHDAGIELFKANRYHDASFRFSKALKLMLSIPIPVDEPLEPVDNTPITEINDLKATFYDSLASCNSMLENFEVVVDLCTRVLEINKDDVKALLKRGTAYSELRDFDKALVDLTKVQELEPTNKAVKEKLKFVNINIDKQKVEYENIVKKMFSK